MIESLQTYELFALRYATRQAMRRDHFIGGDPHDGPMPMDYFLWVAVSPQRTFVIDAGFTAETAAKRKRTFLRDPIDALRLLGIDAEQVKDVIIMHCTTIMSETSIAFRLPNSIYKNRKCITRPGDTCAIRDWRIPSMRTTLPEWYCSTSPVA